MFSRNFGGFMMGAPIFLFRLHDKGPIIPMPGHSVGRGSRSVTRPKIHGFSGADLREMRRVNGVGSQRARRRIQTALARAAKRSAAEEQRKRLADSVHTAKRAVAAKAKRAKAIPIETRLADLPDHAKAALAGRITRARKSIAKAEKRATA